MSFVASPQAHSTSIEADATTKPFFDHEPIEGFFNTINVKGTFLFEAGGFDVGEATG
jgi:hypothetical protein